MEHLTVQGGELYIPFARSCVKRLRAAGLEYASQKFELDDAAISVRLLPDREYIRIEGFEGLLLSGVTQTDSDDEVLFKPTKDAMKIASDKDPLHIGLFNPEIQLAIPLHSSLAYPIPRRLDRPAEMWKYERAYGARTGYTHIGWGDSQYRHVAPSMYSGKMAKLVQILLGYGTRIALPTTVAAVYRPFENTEGAQVQYDYRWLRCHGIVVASDGADWLVEISEKNGVIAVPLDIIPGSKKKARAGTAYGEAMRLFSGLPSGACFAEDSLIPGLISSGDILQLMAPSGLDDVFTKESFSSAMGWSFNDTGSEARNTCWSSTAGISAGSPFEHMKWHPYDVLSHHYKLTLTIGGTVSPEDRVPGQPLATSSATLTLIEEKQLVMQAFDLATISKAIPFAFYEPLVDSLVPTPARMYSAVPATTIASAWEDAPLVVSFINNALDVTRVRWRGTAGVGSTNYGACGPNNPGPTEQRTTGLGGPNIMSDLYPEERYRSIVSSGFYGTIETGRLISGNASGNTAIPYLETTRFSSVKTIGKSMGAWAAGTRDGYCLYQVADKTVTGLQTGGVAASMRYRSVATSAASVTEGGVAGTRVSLAVPQPSNPTLAGSGCAQYYPLTYDGVPEGFYPGSSYASHPNNFSYSYSTGYQSPAWGSATNIQTTTVDAPTKCIFVGSDHGDGVPLVVYPQYADIDEENAYMTLWMNPAELPIVSSAPPKGLTARSSKVGNSSQAVVSQNLEPLPPGFLRLGLVTLGSLLGDITPGNQVHDPQYLGYSFLGFIGAPPEPTP